MHVWHMLWACSCALHISMSILLHVVDISICITGRWHFHMRHMSLACPCVSHAVDMSITCWHVHVHHILLACPCVVHVVGMCWCPCRTPWRSYMRTWTCICKANISFVVDVHTLHRDRLLRALPKTFRV